MITLEKPCKEFQGYLRKGYGQLGTPQWGTRVAHRAAMSEHLGRELGLDEMVCHHCDNRKCVELTHLYVGDAKTNAVDMAARGRTWMQKLKGNYPDHIRKNISEAMAGSVISEARKVEIGNFFRGIPKSEEHREKISKGLRGKERSKEHCKNLRGGRSLFGVVGVTYREQCHNNPWRLVRRGAKGVYRGAFPTLLDAAAMSISLDNRGIIHADD